MTNRKQYFTYFAKICRKQRFLKLNFCTHPLLHKSIRGKKIENVKNFLTLYIDNNVVMSLNFSSFAPYICIIHTDKNNKTLKKKS